MEPNTNAIFFSEQVGNVVDPGKFLHQDTNRLRVGLLVSHIDEGRGIGLREYRRAFADHGEIHFTVLEPRHHLRAGGVPAPLRRDPVRFQDAAVMHHIQRRHRFLYADAHRHARLRHRQMRQQSHACTGRQAVQHTAPALLKETAHYFANPVPLPRVACATEGWTARQHSWRSVFDDCAVSEDAVAGALLAPLCGAGLPADYWRCAGIVPPEAGTDFLG
ncbi:hypothetical protein [Herbaspirillum sp. LeCh32-8]|uniref:hypothetical protein n=1 Tax=Herbaspirillum sp. LeCh32-8 TaxID=2821356 RepID=UPI001AE49C1B|nr:hypothetical protein [Herbaspirillum sp. LeCh32-8]